MEHKAPKASPRFIILLFYCRWFHATDVAKSDGTPFKFKGAKSQVVNKGQPSHWYLSSTKNRKPFGDKDNDSMEAAFQAQKSIKLPVGQDKLHEVDMAQREYYAGNYFQHNDKFIGLVLFLKSEEKFGSLKRVLNFSLAMIICPDNLKKATKSLLLGRISIRYHKNVGLCLVLL